MADGLQTRFYNYYKNELFELCKQVEELRKGYLGKFWLSFFIATMLNSPLILCIILAIYESEGMMIYFAICFLPFVYIIFYVWSWSELFEQYRIEAKSILMDPLLQFFGKDYYYCRQEETVNKNMIRQSELFGWDFSLKTDDAFVGKHKGVFFSLSENKVTGSTGMETNCIMIPLTFSRKIFSKVIVHHRVFNHNFDKKYLLYIWKILFALYALYYLWLGPDEAILTKGPAHIAMDVLLLFPVAALIYYLGVKLIQYGYSVNKNIATESLAFEREWKVISGDEVEARYILTPVMMERIRKLEHYFGGVMGISFWDNQTLLVIYKNKNFFEIASLFKSALNWENLYKGIKELGLILMIIEALAEKRPYSENKGI